MKNIFEMKPMELARATGVSYANAWRHIHNKQKISADFAMRYHKILNIPLWELRPDLWERPAEVSNA